MSSHFTSLPSKHFDTGWHYNICLHWQPRTVLLKSRPEYFFFICLIIQSANVCHLGSPWKYSMWHQITNCKMLAGNKLCSGDTYEVEWPLWKKVKGGASGGGGGRSDGFESWQHGTVQRDRHTSHSSLHTFSHRGSQLTSQCFNPSSLQNKGGTAIGGRGPIYTVASKRLLAAHRNL